MAGNHREPIGRQVKSSRPEKQHASRRRNQGEDYDDDDNDYDDNEYDEDDYDDEPMPKPKLKKARRRGNPRAVKGFAGGGSSGW